MTIKPTTNKETMNSKPSPIVTRMLSLDFISNQNLGVVVTFVPGPKRQQFHVTVILWARRANCPNVVGLGLPGIVGRGPALVLLNG